MPAKNLQRISEEGIYFHIYNKGVENRVIFNDEDDYKVFLGFLKDYLTPSDPKSTKKTFEVHGKTFHGIPHQPKNYFNKVELIAYSLMPDHFHLLLYQKTSGSLENFIRSLCTRYSMYFNKKYKRTGALFEGPYKSVLIKDELLPNLTRYLHYAGNYSSYPEYLDTRKTSWVKSQIILSLFDKDGYKNFVEKYGLDQNEKELIEGLTFDKDTTHLERREPARNEAELTPELKIRSRMPEFLITSSVIFLLLFSLGIRNIMVSTAKSHQSMPTPVSDILSETKESEATPEASLTVKVTINDDSSFVNIRKEATTSAIKIGEAKDGDTFEFISLNLGWYEIKLGDESTGFISERYVVMKEENE